MFEKRVYTEKEAGKSIYYPEAAEACIGFSEYRYRMLSVRFGILDKKVNS